MKFAKRNNPFKINILKLRRGDTLVVYSDDVLNSIESFGVEMKTAFPFLKDVIVLPTEAKLSVIR